MSAVNMMNQTMSTGSFLWNIHIIEETGCSKSQGSKTDHFYMYNLSLLYLVRGGQMIKSGACKGARQDFLNQFLQNLALRNY